LDEDEMIIIVDADDGIGAESNRGVAIVRSCNNCDVVMLILSRVGVDKEDEEEEEDDDDDDAVEVVVVVVTSVANIDGSPIFDDDWSKGTLVEIDGSTFVIVVDGNDVDEEDEDVGND
jgi:carbonic anhydrase